MTCIHDKPVILWTQRACPTTATELHAIGWAVKLVVRLGMQSDTVCSDSEVALAQVPALRACNHLQHPPTHPCPSRAGGGGGVYALHPQSHTSRADLTSKHLPAVGMETGTFYHWVKYHNQLSYHPVLTLLRNKGLRGFTWGGILPTKQ